MAKVDLIIKNGKIATVHGVYEGGLAIDNGKIVAIAKSPDLPDASRAIDAKGKIVMPGVVEDHVHAWWYEDYHRCSRAAAAGGITTMIDQPINVPPTTSAEAIEDKKRKVENDSIIDYAIYGGVTPESVDEIPAMHRAGAVGFKGAMFPTVGFPRLDDASLLEAFRKVKEVGSTIGLHAENEEIILALSEKLKKAGRSDPMAHQESRPIISELEAISRAVLFAREVGNSLVIFHTTIADGAEMVHHAKTGGVNAYVETCPQYLLLYEELMRDMKAYAKFNPPVRPKREAERLWNAMRKGYIDIIGSDHSSWPKEEKDKGEINIWEAGPGAPAVQTTLQLMFSEGVNKGKIALESLVAMMCENPAKIWGIYPRKGTISVGSDGDITILDPKKEGAISPETSHYHTGWTPYEGLKVVGLPVYTIVRGEMVAENGVVVGKPGYGQLITRSTGTS